MQFQCNLLPIIVPLAKAVRCEHTIRAFEAFEQAEIRTELSHIRAPLAIAFEMLRLLEVMSATRCLPKDVGV